MTETFPGYYRPTKEQFERLWKECVFALDANVLLNLYRYPSNARDELLRVLTSVKERIWLPYQAALEFQRNRPAVLADQKKKFRDVRIVLDSIQSTLEADLAKLQLRKRHSSIDPDKLITAVGASIDAFKTTLAEQEGAQVGPENEDQLRSLIDALVGDNLGLAPASQDYLNNIYKEGGDRFAAGFPPGYRDAKKEGVQYTFGGMVYRSEFGDLVVWKQLIDEAKRRGLKSVVLLTDDDKDDWRWVVDSLGKKRMGPRPELVDEIKRLAGVEMFYMYSSEQFLKLSREYLQAKVTDESIEQVREVSSGPAPQWIFTDSEKVALSRRHLAIAQWLRDERFPGSTIKLNTNQIPDFLVHLPSGEKVGLEIFFLNELSRVDPALPNLASVKNMALHSGCSDFIGLFVLADDLPVRTVFPRLVELGEAGTKVIAGFFVADGNAGYGQRFVPLFDLP